MKKFALSEVLVVLVFGGLLGFLGLTLRAAVAYPGGTFCEPDARSYRFWGNYFCDLTAPVTGRGIDNSLAAASAHAAFASFALALGPFFWLLAGLAGRRLIIRSCGLVSAFATAVLAWVPSGFGPTLHATAVFGATVPGLIAAGVGVYGLGLRTVKQGLTRAAFALGVATFLAGFATAAGYAYVVATHGGCVPCLPVLQKAVGMLLVSWMLLVALAAEGTVRAG